MKKHITTFLILMAFIAAFASAGYAAGDATVVKDFKTRAVEGLLPNSEIYNLISNEETSTSPFVAYPWIYQSAYPWPAAAATMEVASSSATDTGTAVVTVYYLDANWDEQDEDITLTGQTEVSMSEPAIRVNRLVMKTPAAGETSNVGDIYCANGATFTSGVPDTGIIAKIRATEGRSTGMFFSVARNKHAVIDEFVADVASANTMEVALQSRTFGGPFVDQERRIIHGESFSGTNYGLIAEKSDVFVTFDGQAASDDAHFSLTYHVKEEQ